MRITIVVLAAALLVPAAANAQTYPEPKDPGKVEPKPPRPYETHTVCKKGRCDFRTIQAAVNAADAGDTIRVKRGVYREAVRINGRRKRYLKLIGNPRRPGRVVLDGRGRMQNGFAVNNADEVTVSGFKARRYRANGFFFTNLNGYTMNHLIARHTGVYGLYAFNTIGGTIKNSEAYYVNDGAFYIGQTPPQDKPVQSLVTNVDGWGSPIGFSGTNMRYVTITKSRFYNNAIGLVPDSEDGEKFPPPEKNVIIDNDIFWNNFNYHAGHPPFAVRKTGNAALAPVGTGILLFGGKGNRVENNRVYGNFLAGVGMVQGFLAMKDPEAQQLRDNVVQGNQFGLGGTDVNGFDYVYDGNGTNNCWSMDGVTSTFPADRSTYAGCGGTNAFSASVQQQMLAWVGEGALAAWNKHPHPAKPGFTPLEVFK